MTKGTKIAIPSKTNAGSSTIDMVILGNKKKKDYEQAMLTKCQYCAELIKKEANICKHCGKEIEIS